MAFFDKVKSNLDKGIATVSTGSKVMLEKTKINSAIKTLEEEKKQLEGLMGIKVFSAIAAGATEIQAADVQSLYDEIVSRIQQIEAQKAKIADLDKEMSTVTGGNSPIPVACPCGEINPAGSKFCAKCGRTLN